MSGFVKYRDGIVNPVGLYYKPQREECPHCGRYKLTHYRQHRANWKSIIPFADSKGSHFEYKTWENCGFRTEDFTEETQW